MELDRIDKLIEKYFEATSTVVEEQELREYFSNGEIAERHEEFAPMFAYFTQAKEERSSRKVPLKPRRINYKWLSVAAVTVMMFGLYFGKIYQDNRQEEERALLAYQQTKQALNLLAENLDRGTSKVAYLNEFQEAKEKLIKND